MYELCETVYIKPEVDDSVKNIFTESSKFFTLKPKVCHTVEITFYELFDLLNIFGFRYKHELFM